MFADVSLYLSWLLFDRQRFCSWGKTWFFFFFFKKNKVVKDSLMLFMKMFQPYGIDFLDLQHLKSASNSTWKAPFKYAAIVKDAVKKKTNRVLMLHDT